MSLRIYLYFLIRKCVVCENMLSCLWSFGKARSAVHIIAYPVSCGWAKASASSLPICLVLSAEWSSYGTRLVRHFISFPFERFPGGDKHCPSIISYPADVPCPGPLPSSDLSNHVCDLCLFWSRCLDCYECWNVQLLSWVLRYICDI